MRIRTISFGAFALIFSILLMISCGDAKKEASDKVDEQAKEAVEAKESHHDASADHAYQCPMDCEDGKTYAQAGSCPVCKMDLAALDKSETSADEATKAVSCAMHEGGECSCEGDKCKCDNCDKHS